MNSLWSRRATPDRHASPLDMRFIDLFMAALGALLFMAIVLVLLVEPHPVPPPIPGSGSTPPVKQENLKILTKILPAAETGKPYEMAIAYRGGSGPVAWDLAAGQHEIPGGMKFNRTTGILQGTPGKEGLARFVVRARDRDTSEVQAYELNILRGKSEERGVEKWLAGILLFILVLVWFVTVFSINQAKAIIGAMEKAYQSGQSAYAMTIDNGITEHITLPQGITTYQERLLFAKKIGKYLGFIILALSAWFIWRLWFH